MLIILALSFNLEAQKLKGFSYIQDYSEASLLMEEGLYDRARPIWQKLLQEYPDSYNLNYKLGLCYLKSDYFGAYSLKYLEIATKGISKRYDPFNELEKNTPRESLYHLALAYHLNEKFDESATAYNSVLKSIPSKHILAKEILFNQAKNTYAKQAYQNADNNIKLVYNKNINSRKVENWPMLHPSNEALLFASNRTRKSGSN